MKKILFRAMVFAAALTILMPVISIPAMASNDYFTGYNVEIDKDSYYQAEGLVLAEPGKTSFAFGYLVIDSKDGCYLRMTDPDIKRAYITILYKTNSGYGSVSFDITGPGYYWVGEGSGPNGVIQARIGRLLTPPGES
jgi:hypothetical protein